MICKKCEKTYKNFFDFEVFYISRLENTFNSRLLDAFVKCGKKMMNPQLYQFELSREMYSDKFNLHLVDGVYSCPFCDFLQIDDPIENNSIKIDEMRKHLLKDKSRLWE